MGESIKGHMTMVDRLYTRLLCGQFVHSVKNKSIQVFDYLTAILHCFHSLTTNTHGFNQEG